MPLTGPSFVRPRWPTRVELRNLLFTLSISLSCCLSSEVEEETRRKTTRRRATLWRRCGALRGGKDVPRHAAGPSRHSTGVRAVEAVTAARLLQHAPPSLLHGQRRARAALQVCGGVLSRRGQSDPILFVVTAAAAAAAVAAAGIFSRTYRAAFPVELRAGATSLSSSHASYVRVYSSSPLDAPQVKRAILPRRVVTGSSPTPLILVTGGQPS